MTNQEFPESFTLELRARHFHETKFCVGRCAIEKALDELHPEWNADEAVSRVYTYFGGNSPSYQHGLYGDDSFHFDFAAAYHHNFDDTIIRTIKMTRV